jgi:CDP-diacylglycerol--glycerol-3-phosphate 3-phosphatidyltransferase
MSISTPAPKAAPARISPWPSILSAARAAAGLIIAALLVWGDHSYFVHGKTIGAWIYVAAFVSFAAAALSDAADGWLARKLNATSPFGAALDHAADKVLTTTTLAALAVTQLPTDLIAAALIIIARDMLMAGLREGLLAQGARAAPVDAWGKWKTIVLMTAIGAVLLAQALAASQIAVEALGALSAVARFGLWAAAALAVASAGRYIANFSRKPTVTH